MTGVLSLIKRNCRLFFKDKGMFFTSLITPAILLVLYITFLGKVYKDAFIATIGDLPIPEKLIDAAVAGQLISSLLAVSCVTVAFCSNLLMVQDKVTGAVKDLKMTPATNGNLSISYFVATAITTIIVCFTALGLSFIYLAKVGWYLTITDVLLLCLDVVLLTLFGTALSSIIISPLSTNGQASAVGTIVSSGYGFISGAYMPISNFSQGLQRVLSFFPGTYGTVMLRLHALVPVFSQMEADGVPKEAIDIIKEATDCKVFFFDKEVGMLTMYAILVGSILLLVAGYVCLNEIRNRRRAV